MPTSNKCSAKSETQLFFLIKKTLHLLYNIIRNWRGCEQLMKRKTCSTIGFMEADPSSGATSVCGIFSTATYCVNDVIMKKSNEKTIWKKPHKKPPLQYQMVTALQYRTRCDHGKIASLAELMSTILLYPTQINNGSSLRTDKGRGLFTIWSRCKQWILSQQ